ncbi:unnamed protein product [Ectocarpus sp. 6 AP-2014]
MRSAVAGVLWGAPIYNPWIVRENEVGLPIVRNNLSDYTLTIDLSGVFWVLQGEVLEQNLGGRSEQRQQNNITAAVKRSAVVEVA